jgi:hypothetical protein
MSQYKQTFQKIRKDLQVTSDCIKQKGINDVSSFPDSSKLGNLVNAGGEKTLLSRLTRDVDASLKDTAEVSMFIIYYYYYYLLQLSLHPVAVVLS